MKDFNNWSMNASVTTLRNESNPFQSSTNEYLLLRMREMFISQGYISNIPIKTSTQPYHASNHPAAVIPYEKS